MLEISSQAIRCAWLTRRPNFEHFSQSRARTAHAFINSFHFSHLIIQRTAQDVLAIRFPFRYKKRFDWEISNYAAGTSRSFDLSATLLFLFGTSNIHVKQVALEDRTVKMYYSPYQTAIQTDQMIERKGDARDLVDELRQTYVS